MPTKHPHAKNCSACGKRKTYSMFARNSRTEDGLMHKCRLCMIPRKKLQIDMRGMLSG